MAFVSCKMDLFSNNIHINELYFLVAVDGDAIVLQVDDQE